MRMVVEREVVRHLVAWYCSDKDVPEEYNGYTSPSRCHCKPGMIKGRGVMWILS